MTKAATAAYFLRVSETRAEKIANELGLKYTTKLSPDGKWTKFNFEFPGIDAVKTVQTVTWPGVPKNLEVPRSLTETIEKVTKWRSKMKPWLFVGSADTVATKQTFATKRVVASWNRKNRKVIKNAQKQLSKSEAYARQLAMSQQHPGQGINVLDQMTKLAEPETQMLRKKLVEAAQIADLVVANARKHVDGTCGCPVEPCDVAKAEAANAKVAAEAAEARANAPPSVVVDFAAAKAQREPAPVFGVSQGKDSA